MDTPLNEAQFTNIPPGNYLLKVRYNDGITDYENRTQNLRIVILPPWYASLIARIIYVLSTVGALILMYLYLKDKYKKKKKMIAKELDEKYKEEMYEGKLRFFTNITHELCTPLTLIYVPCERILSHDGSDSFVKKYTRIIKSNTERLNSLIQEVIDFRRMETGNKKILIQPLNISSLLFDMKDAFNELSEQNNIDFNVQVVPDIIWNTDYSCFTKILNNLISNAFKYTPSGGEITVSTSMDNDTLHLKVYNTGKGICKEDIPSIFNRYSVLDNIRENTIKGLSSRNGLGLAICHSMTELLRGKIEVESELNRYARFIVSLPFLEQNGKDTDNMLRRTPEDLRNRTYSKEEEEEAGIENEDSCDDRKKHNVRILVIDDNRELLWMIKEILSDEYTVITATDGKIGLQQLQLSTPDLIITDIIMPDMDGISLIRKLKENQYTTHIPIIILSAKNAIDEQIEGIESGSDVYIPKPFDAQYLKTVIKHLIKNRENLQQYYNSSASAYDFSKGQLMHKEDRDFLQTAIRIIDDNIDNSDFLPDNLASGLQISVRNLYRKFKDLNQPSPKDFIKKQRIIYAAKLLLTTTQTIQEIMYKTGFTNRSHFYKEFAKYHNNQTPKEYRTSHSSL
jgi:signal transduction histidine kinase/DNA-binding NarL/FixJ family response regulator